MKVTLRAPANPLDWLCIRLLYRQAFPRCERKPFKMIRNMHHEGRTTINSTDIILLDYLAVSKKKRSLGVGSAMLQGLLALYEGRGLFVEIEATDRDDPTGEKARRKAFYLRNGLEEMHVTAMLFGVRMELLGRGCTLDFDAYHDFYRDNYSAWAAEHVTLPND